MKIVPSVYAFLSSPAAALVVEILRPAKYAGLRMTRKLTILYFLGRDSGGTRPDSR
jgi:hypothetical protein